MLPTRALMYRKSNTGDYGGHNCHSHTPHSHIHTQVEGTRILGAKAISQDPAAVSHLSLVLQRGRAAQCLRSSFCQDGRRKAASLSNSLSGNSQEGLSSPSPDVSKQRWPFTHSRDELARGALPVWDVHEISEEQPMAGQSGDPCPPFWLPGGVQGAKRCESPKFFFPQIGTGSLLVPPAPAYGNCPCLQAINKLTFVISIVSFSQSALLRGSAVD